MPIVGLEKQVAITPPLFNCFPRRGKRKARGDFNLFTGESCFEIRAASIWMLMFLFRRDEKADASKSTLISQDSQSKSGITKV